MYYSKHKRFCNMRAHKSARHVQFQEKGKTPTTELNIFLSKIFFRRKIIRKGTSKRFFGLDNHCFFDFTSNFTLQWNAFFLIIIVNSRLYCSFILQYLLTSQNVLRSSAPPMCSNFLIFSG